MPDVQPTREAQTRDDISTFLLSTYRLLVTWSQLTDCAEFDAYVCMHTRRFDNTRVPTGRRALPVAITKLDVST
jgi:hypothetical protein